MQQAAALPLESVDRVTNDTLRTRRRTRPTTQTIVCLTVRSYRRCVRTGASLQQVISQSPQQTHKRPYENRHKDRQQERRMNSVLLTGYGARCFSLRALAAGDEEDFFDREDKVTCWRSSHPALQVV